MSFPDEGHEGVEGEQQWRTLRRRRQAVVEPGGEAAFRQQICHEGKRILRISITRVKFVSGVAVGIDTDDGLIA